MTDKTLGDYGTEIEKAMANNSLDGVRPIIAEMKASLPPADPQAPQGAPPEPAPPVNRGKEAYIEGLETAVQTNNVFVARQLAEEMVAVEPPSPPPPEAPAEPAPPPPGA